MRVTLYRDTPIRWIRDPHAKNMGRGYHGLITVGTIQKARAYGVPTGDWEWGMVVTGNGRVPEKCRGVAPSKEAAVEACNAAYIALMEIAGNYEAAEALYRQVEESTRFYLERRATFGPVDESRGGDTNKTEE